MILNYWHNQDAEKTKLIQTLKLLKEVNYINSYSFVFSARPGTPAADLKKVDEKVSKERLIIFQNLAILNGIFGVGELSDGIEKKISTFGEILSSNIFYQITKYHNLKSDFFDSRKIIFIKKSTISLFGKLFKLLFFIN